MSQNSRESADPNRINLPLKQAIEALLTDRPVAYHPIITRVIGSATAGIFLSQLLYWTPRSQDPGGWVYKTQEEILEETGLTRTEQETARRILRTAQVMEETKRGLPAKLYFRVNMDRLIALLSVYQPRPGKRQRPVEAPAATPEPPVQGCGDPATKDAGTLQPRMRESRRPVRGNPAHQPAAIPHAFTESTTEITTEIVVVVRDALEKFGLTKTVADRFAETYPEDYLLAKLDFVQWLVDSGSRLVGRNPAGYLRRAIEDDYAPPATYRRVAQRRGVEQNNAEDVAAAQTDIAALEQRHHAQADAARQQLIDRTPTTAIPGTGRTTVDVWDAVLAQLREQVTGPIFATWLKGTRLAACDGRRATVATVYRYTAEQLSDRLHPRIVQALADVLGQPVTAAYVTLAELEDEDAGHSVDEPPSKGKSRRAGGAYVAG